MDTHGYPWISTDAHGYPWISMAIHEIHMDIHGYPWISYPWIFMDIYGYPRISMDVPATFLLSGLGRVLQYDHTHDHTVSFQWLQYMMIHGISQTKTGLIKTPCLMRFILVLARSQ